MKIEPAKILHVEDDLEQITFFAYVVQRYVNLIKVHTASTLAETIAMLRTEKYDAVLLDLCLPDSKGVETVLKVREVDRYIPIIVLTGSNNPRLAAECMAAGAAGFMIKTQVDFRILIEMLLTGVEERRKVAALDEETANVSVLRAQSAIESLRERSRKLQALSAEIENSERPPDDRLPRE